MICPKCHTQFKEGEYFGKIEDRWVDFGELFWCEICEEKFYRLFKDDIVLPGDFPEEYELCPL